MSTPGHAERLDYVLEYSSCLRRETGSVSVTQTGLESAGLRSALQEVDNVPLVGSPREYQRADGQIS